MTTLPKAFSPEVLAELARPFVTFDHRNAEMQGNLAATWHVIETYANADRSVAEDLSSRRFGIYLPEEARTEIKRGRKVDIIRPMFPGYLFVFVWLTDQNYTRIRSTPGVLQFLACEGRPLVISDALVDVVRAVENGQRPVWRPRKARGYRKQKTNDDDVVVSAHPLTEFQDRLMRLDSKIRNQTLRKALGLSLVPSP
ncbi:transcription termination/antitermination protein NusG [Bradyrhizobium sp. JYMT SZCCT0428]|uniref:transcription termination/antitermination protein NusG n=1 Tax=Bradyrhizobium sp. JYMT SZCCT0428 TaxID=2807673 RepID=UPI001BAD8CFE|nr:transcription termination/antitermination NusG family protein [Bradyrhizobium sp. JYMT SZCCT0428]MBR1150105.1 transcription termination/antitermination NusG family protein [Bradyrhizobium sp. JYMT SZCCT0428]